MLGLISLPGVSGYAAFASTEAPECPDGYRRLGALHDFALGKAWTIYANCAHPEMPRLAVAEGGRTVLPRAVAGGEGGKSSPSEAEWPAEPRILAGRQKEDGAFNQTPAPEVAAGAQVRLWKRDGVVAIDLPGTALESGSTGARIRVRVAPAGKVLRGTVRGPASVELDPRAVPGFLGEGR